MALPKDEEIDRALANAGLKMPDDMRDHVLSAIRTLHALAQKLKTGG